jgi:hypothetical protein
MTAKPLPLEARAARMAEKVVGMVTQASPPDGGDEDAPGYLADELPEDQYGPWEAWEAAIGALEKTETAAGSAERSALRDEVERHMLDLRHSAKDCAYALGLQVGLRLARLVHEGGAR